MAVRQIELPPKLIPVFEGEAPYRCAYGGRGSAKTRSFATMSAVWGYRLAEAGERGLIVCGREFQNSLEESSFPEVKNAILGYDWLADYYEVGEKYIRTKNGRIDFSFIGLRRSLQALKSKFRILVLWVDEAEMVSEPAWEIATPTVREAASEIWVSWNPGRKGSPTDLRFRQDPPTGAKIVALNWRDNPWWYQSSLEQKRLDDKEKRPDQYDHVWEGDYVTVVAGAYFAKDLTEARAKGRIGKVSADPLMTYRAIWDIGGTGAKADACAIWIAQFVGKEIRALDYYEAQGQPLAAHVAWLRDNGYGKALCILPHDGETHDRVHDVSFESYLKSAGFETEVIPNQGKGAAAMRIEAARRLFASVWFNEETTEAGREALGWYHEKRDDERLIGLGPNHDWSSHGADAFGLMCVAYEAPIERKKPTEVHYGEGAWMG